MQNFEAYGVMTVHFKVYQQAQDENQAIEAVQELFASISKLEGILYSSNNGSELPVMADKVNIKIYDVVCEYDL